jgi:DNA helicase-2/ATP-dependent DNA helicase PcrA
LEGALTILQNKHILAVVAQRKDEFTSAPFVWLHSILRLANERQNKEYLEAVCGAFLQLTNIEIDLDDIMSQAQSGNYDYLKAWIKLTQQNANSPDINNIIQQVEKCLVERNNIKKFSDLALKWFDSLCTEPHSKHSDPMIEKFSEYGEEAIVWKNLLREILRSLGQGLTLEAFLQELQMHSKEAEPDAGTVRLMSIHAAKGKEFDHVYLIGMVDDELPSFQSKQKGDRSPEMEEERRSCFVAITRTIKTLTLSCANRYRGWEKKPSRFLIEMGLLKEQDIY